MPPTKRLKLHFADEGLSFEARLLESEAPEVCRQLWERLPFEGEIIHGQWSGPEAYLLIDPDIRIGPENEKLDPHPGDIGYYAAEGGRFAGWPEDMAELCFVYGEGARPSMIDGPIPVSVFARIERDMERFVDLCERLRREGVKSLRVERAE